jgi:hypothetical protein
MNLTETFVRKCDAAAVKTYDMNYEYKGVDISTRPHLKDNSITAYFYERSLELKRVCRFRADDILFVFYCPESSSRDKEYEAAMKDVIEVTIFARNLTGGDTRGLIITACLNDIPRFYDPRVNLDVTNPIFINGGLVNGKRIFLWRMEDISKVCLHELLHFFKVDMRHMNIDTKGIYEVEGYDNVSEGVTEAMARIIYCAYVSKQLRVPLRPLLESQLKLSMYQAAHILRRLGFDDTSQIRSAVIRQKTYAFEYYVVSACIMYRCAEEGVFEAVLDNDVGVVTGIIRNGLRSNSPFCRAVDVLMRFGTFGFSTRMSI